MRDSRLYASPAIIPRIPPSTPVIAKKNSARPEESARMEVRKPIDPRRPKRKGNISGGLPVLCRDGMLPGFDSESDDVRWSILPVSILRKFGA
jgi:hypothetical protein